MSKLTYGLEKMDGKTPFLEKINAKATKAFYLKHDSIYGSDATFCAKKACLHLSAQNGEVAESSSASLFYFEIGNSIHATFQKLAKPWSVGIELRVTNGLGVHGYIDIILWEGGAPKIVDIKTCGKLPVTIKPAHASQLLTYCLLSGIRTASIVYFSRSVAGFDGQLRTVELELEVTDEMLYSAAKVMATAAVCADVQKVPNWPQPGRISKRSCGFCPFLKLCHDGEDVWWGMKEGWEFADKLTMEEQTKVEGMAMAIVDNMSKKYQKTMDLCVAAGLPLAKELRKEGVI